MKPIDRLQYALMALEQRHVAVEIASSAIRTAIRQIEKLEHDLAVARASNGMVRAELLNFGKAVAAFPPLEGDA